MVTGQTGIEGLAVGTALQSTSVALALVDEVIEGVIAKVAGSIGQVVVS